MSVEVPRWMTDAMDGRPASPRLAGPEQGRRVDDREWRDSVVAGAVGFAKAIKSSAVSSSSLSSEAAMRP